MTAVAGQIQLTEDDIHGTEFAKEVQKLTRAEALRWLKCRGCRNLSDLNVKELKNKVKL